MCSLFNNVSILHNQNPVCRLYGGQPMGHHKAGPPFHQLFKCLLHPDFCSRINGRGGLIQNQHGRTHEHHPGDTQKLLLSLGNVFPILHNPCIIPILHPLDKSVGMSLPGGLLDLLSGSVRLSIRDILGKPIKKEGVPFVLRTMHTLLKKTTKIYYIVVYSF